MRLQLLVLLLPLLLRLLLAAAAATAAVVTRVLHTLLPLRRPPTWCARQALMPCIIIVC